eukprot:GHVR01159552.1.p1 GENE.GHVR01159552.1~~GHVR01159552.1.p1  ORF type:complete len:552 (+),score=129.05 GHVR01159552.1:56-1657(+)
MVVLRGSQNYLDALVDFDYSLETDTVGYGKVNTLKYDYAVKIYEAIVSNIGNPNELFVVGHALGGSMGALVAYLIKQHFDQNCYHTKVAYIGFAVNNMGDNAFWQRTMKLISYRVYAYEDDIIPWSWCHGCTSQLENDPPTTGVPTCPKSTGVPVPGGDTIKSGGVRYGVPHNVVQINNSSVFPKVPMDGQYVPGYNGFNVQSLNFIQSHICSYHCWLRLLLFPKTLKESSSMCDIDSCFTHNPVSSIVANIGIQAERFRSQYQDLSLVGSNLFTSSPIQLMKLGASLLLPDTTILWGDIIDFNGIIHSHIDNHINIINSHIDNSNDSIDSHNNNNNEGRNHIFELDKLNDLLHNNDNNDYRRLNVEGDGSLRGRGGTLLNSFLKGGPSFNTGSGGVVDSMLPHIILGNNNKNENIDTDITHDNNIDTDYIFDSIHDGVLPPIPVPGVRKYAWDIGSGFKHMIDPLVGGLEIVRDHTLPSDAYTPSTPLIISEAVANTIEPFSTYEIQDCLPMPFSPIDICLTRAHCTDCNVE